MKNLNEAQQKAVKHFRGPCLVIAAPGSGKTTVIAERTAYLIDKHQVPSQNILVITFTKAAAKEMKERFHTMMQGSGNGVWFGTFHAVFFNILKHAYHYTVNDIIREDVKKRILQELIREKELDGQSESDLYMQLESEISLVKGQGLDLEHYYSASCPADIFRDIYRGYQQTLKKKHLLDFDDMLVYTYELLNERKDILAMWQKQFPFILIDEFQDINKIQYDVVKLLAGEEQNLFIVGDDDQSIYRFRGARPEIMLHFEKDYPRTKRILLDVNYRSDANIISAAEAVIRHNKERFSKTIHAHAEAARKVDVAQFDNIGAQNDMILRRMQENHENGMPWEDMAVLVRTNTGARSITSKLSAMNIPFTMKEMFPNPYEHWTVKNVSAYMEIARGATARALFLQIANKPLRYISRDAFAETEVDLEEVKKYYEDKEWMVERIEEWQEHLEMLADMPPYGAIRFIRNVVGYDDYLRTYAREHHIKPEELMQVLDEVQEEAKNHDTYEAWLLHIEKFSEELKEQWKKKQREEKNGVQIVTMHSSKGLEYRVVFIPDANEGVTPHHKAVLDADMEEERRMFYVAMTRAKERLHIYYTKERFGKAADVSRFVEEILE